MSERACLEQMLSKAELRLSVLQEVVAEAKNTCVQLRRAINQRAPIATLPVDVKLEIFLHAHHDVLPLVLGAVCKEWRDIAWHSPQLWDTIDLVLSQDHYKTQVILLKDWLKRGGQCPLLVFLRYNTRVAVIYNHGQNPGLDCLSMLFRQSHRWEHVEFCIPRDEIINLLHEPGDLPLLRSLCLDFDVPDEWISPRHTSSYLLRYFAEAPLLHTANTNDYDLADIDFPWKQLEVLNYHFYNICDDHFYKTLKQAQNLVHYHHYAIGSENPTNQGVYLPKLRSITLDDDETLKIMDLPSLKDLYIRSEWDKLKSEVLLDFVNSSLCHITTFDARAPDFIGDFMTLMRYIPSLLNLRLSLEKSKHGLLNHLIEALHPDCATPLLPNLETLMYEGKTSFPYGLLVDVLEQRWKKGGPSSDKSKSVSQFKSIHINSTNAIPGMDESAIDNKLAVLRSEGMDIIISAGTAVE